MDPIEAKLNEVLSKYKAEVLLIEQKIASLLVELARRNFRMKFMTLSFGLALEAPSLEQLEEINEKLHSMGCRKPFCTALLE
jgi:hypothetical protein